MKKYSSIVSLILAVCILSVTGDTLINEQSFYRSRKSLETLEVQTTYSLRVSLVTHPRIKLSRIIPRNILHIRAGNVPDNAPKSTSWAKTVESGHGTHPFDQSHQSAEGSQPSESSTPKAATSTRPRFHFIENFFYSLFSKFVNDLDLLRICAKVASWFFWTYTVLSILGTVGVDTKPLLSLLGISGITLGFSMKDILSDINAGLYVLFTRPFSRGSIISVNGFKGEVTSIDVRHVRLYSETEKVTTLVPLSMVYKNAIKLEDSRVDK